MTEARKALSTRLTSSATSPALRQIRQMADGNSSEVDFSAPLQTVGELLSVWSIRLWNATLRGRRFVGLAEFVRALMRLGSNRKVEQIAVGNGTRVGLIFFDAETKQPIGAVIAVRGAIDERRSRQNLAKANGMPFPSILPASLANSR